MNEDDSNIALWNINSSAPANSEWDFYVDFDYNGSYKTNSAKTYHQPTQFINLI